MKKIDLGQAVSILANVGVLAGILFLAVELRQNNELYGDLTVRENLAFIADIYSYSRQDQTGRIEELIEQYDLVDQRKQFAGTLSGGQRQRLALACAVLNKPKLLLLDEPTSAVDPTSRRDFWAKLFALADSGTTILVSTHYMDEAERCHRLAILDHGHKVADGSPAELQAATHMSIIEVLANDPQAAQNQLGNLAAVASITQLGIRLRVLIPDTIDDPLGLVDGVLTASNLTAKTEIVSASLEDVFVAATMENTGAEKAA